MPTYEYRCNETGRHFEISYKTYADFDGAVPRSPYTGSTNVTRIIRRVAIARSNSVQLDRIESGDLDALAELENADPQTLGRVMRHFGSQLDEDLGTEFDEVVERLESGQTPEEIERTMPLGGDDVADVGGGGTPIDTSQSIPLIPSTGE
ncbi:MAG: zinc ribbon domain-containing protein [Anaerolineae bacterium]|nr:zinc ribbon domain-containing protein [Anaerolineae bacterium]